MEEAKEYAAAVAVVLPWVAMVGTTEVATDITATCAMATTVALAVEAPCTMESRGPCGGNPQISTGTTDVATDRTAACVMATTVAHAVEAPCTMESSGP